MWGLSLLPNNKQQDKYNSLESCQGRFRYQEKGIHQKGGEALKKAAQGSSEVTTLEQFKAMQMWHVETWFSGTFRPTQWS